MAEWHAQGLVLHAQKYAEYDALVTLFTAEHGLVRGMVKRGMRPKQRVMLEPGCTLSVRWHARLPEHLGTLNIEMVRAYPALVLHAPMKLAAVQSVCALLSTAMAEHDPHPKLYACVQDFFEHLVDEALAENWLARYVSLEIFLLEEAGFGLDLSRCAATGSTENLTYISPKTGRAVSAEAGAAYHDRLLPMAGCLTGAPDAGGACVPNGLRVTGHFLENALFSTLDRPLPSARESLTTRVSRDA